MFVVLTVINISNTLIKPNGMDTLKIKVYFCVKEINNVQITMTKINMATYCCVTESNYVNSIFNGY
jgi:hypothetical protein